VGLKVFDPVVDGPARDPQAFGYVLHVVASIEPEQGLCAAQVQGILGMDDQVLQRFVLPVAEGDKSHRLTS
jgi:hypothetical protein